MRSIPVLMAILLFWCVVGADASIIVTPTNDPQQPGQENVLLNVNSGPASTIFGTTNQSGFQVSFTGATALTANANGQSFIQGPAAGFNSMVIALPQNGAFTSLILALTLLGNGTSCSSCVSFSANANEPGGGTAVAQGGPFSAGPGLNFFTVQAQGGETLNSVTVSGSSAFDTIRQVRIGGFTIGGVPIPEPSTYVLLGCGLALFVIGKAGLMRGN